MNTLRSVFTIIILMIVFSSASSQKMKVPELWNTRVHDEANVLSQQAVDYLEKKLKLFEDSTSNQIAILIVPSLQGDVIEEFGMRVAKEWKLGTKNKDNGIIILVSTGDRKMRIEVGHGLEGALPDAIANRIIRNEMAPYFRRGDYDGGIVAATNAVIAATKGEYKGEGRRGGSGRGNSRGGIPTWLILFVIIGVISFLQRRNGGGRSGGWSSGGGWFIGGGSGGWGRSGGGGGGFSGGGGSFGGGGSSGSW